ncbi:MAG: hypothetical protein AAFN74_11235 [Myxococcota bacterium]
MANVEFEDDINEWMESFRELPEDRQDNLKRWFATQKIIIENAGLSANDWFLLVQWAMDNPMDYSFILDFPEQAEHDPELDSSERSDATKGARDLIAGGKADPKVAPDGPGIKEKAQSSKTLERELFSNFMKGRLGSK